MKTIVHQMKKAGCKIVPAVAAAAALVTVAAGNASAALVWTGVDLNTADVETAMGLIIGGLAVLWGFRKIIKTMNRS